MSSEKHFSLPERQKYFPAPVFLPSCGGFMFVMTAPFGSLKLTS
jgi:hypothetical protein